MEYYDVRKLLYLETDASEVGLGTALLQVRDNLKCGYDEVPDNTLLWPISFASKSLSSGHDRWCGHKRQKDFSIADADIEPAAQQLHGNLRR